MTTFYNGDSRPTPTVEQMTDGIKKARQLLEGMDRVRWETLAEESKHRRLTMDEMRELFEIIERFRSRR